MEKLALYLIHMTRRLRRYFEAHPPEGVRIRFSFDRAQRHRVHLCSLSHLPSTKNEAECEALLAGLRIARQMNISNIEIDSKLVASQINRTYEANKDSMIRYLAKAKEYVFGFKSFSIENIPRNTNQKADVLSKLASVMFNHLTKEVLVEVLNERSTENQEVHTIVKE
nr:reverse transcriptase domain-containing protein [Tanacetum cinerariifolium]